MLWLGYEFALGLPKYIRRFVSFVNSAWNLLLGLLIPFNFIILERYSFRGRLDNYSIKIRGIFW
jgi:hypothetical protein